MTTPRPLDDTLADLQLEVERLRGHRDVNGELSRIFELEEQRDFLLHLLGQVAEGATEEVLAEVRRYVSIQPKRDDRLVLAFSTRKELALWHDLGREILQADPLSRRHPDRVPDPRTCAAVWKGVRGANKVLREEVQRLQGVHEVHLVHEVHEEPAP